MVSAFNMRKVPAPDVPPACCPGLSVPPLRTVTGPDVWPVPASVAPLWTVVAEVETLPCRSSTPALSTVAPV